MITRALFIPALGFLVLTSCAQTNASSNRIGLSTDPGRALFLKNCAHCHGADAHGNEGPDLHNLEWTKEQITTRIRNGKKGQMAAFAGKLSPEQIKSIVSYLRTLK